MKKTITVIAAAATVVLLGACGTAKANEAVSNEQPKPAVTTTVKVETVPSICLSALNAADKAIQTAGEGFGIVAEAMQAAGNFDAAGIESATNRLTTLNESKLTPALGEYKTARDACEAAAR